MKFYNIFRRLIKPSILLLLCIAMPAIATGQSKKETKTREKVEISLKVVDQDGKPVPQTQVVVGEGVVNTLTDENGLVKFSAFPDDNVTVSKNAFEEVFTNVSELVKNNSVSLVKSKLFMTSNDNIPLPFMDIRKRYTTGSSNVIWGSQLDKAITTDIRNALTGLAPGMEVLEKNGAPGSTPEENLGVFGITQKYDITSRGFRMLYVIDDVPVDVTEMPLNPQEIQSVTIIKDVIAKAMYGPLAANGVIYIRTKRGKMNDRNLNVNLETGVSSIDRMPRWVSPVEYANLNNKARLNSGIPTLYSDADITAYGNNDPYDMYHPAINYRDMMLKNTRSFNKVNFSSSGGNDVVQYFSNLAYTGEGDIYKIGEKANYNQLTTRSNLDVKINDDLKVLIDLYAGLTFRNSPNYDYDSDYSSEDPNSNPALNLIELPSVLDDITSISPVAFPVYAAFDKSTNIPWFAVTRNYRVNPIGNITNNGYYTEKGRTGSLNFTLDYKPWFIKGLTSKTKMGYNGLDLIRTGKAEDYIAYIANPSKTALGQDTVLLSKVHDGYNMSGQAKMHDYYYQRFSVSENLSYEKYFGDHHIQTALTYFLYKVSKNGIEEPQRFENGVLSALYSFKDKYSLQAVLDYSGTYSFMKDKRWGMFPSVGASWVISEENFMKNLKFIDFLKLRANAGILGYEGFIGTIYYRTDWNYDGDGTDFGPYSGTTKWFGSSMDVTVYRTSANRLGNPDISWEKRKEFSAGFDALLFNQSLSLELTYYNNLQDGKIIQRVNSFPYVVGLSSALQRFNDASTRYYGIEAGLQYRKTIGQLTYSIGGNMTIQNSEYVKLDEAGLRYPYQSLIGKPVDAYFGQTYLGKFGTDDETKVVAQLFDNELHAGDLKYADINNDGIVDDNDQSMIGNTAPRLFYAVNASVRYKNFEFTAVGTGRALYDLPLTNKYFWNGWGDNNYSEFVRDNVGGAYPSLTYYKVNNNFQDSKFWLTKGDYFKIQNVEIAYHIPTGLANLVHGRLFTIYLRGANLATFTKVKAVDPESTSSGVSLYPLYRTFSAGIKLNF